MDGSPDGRDDGFDSRRGHEMIPVPPSRRRMNHELGYIDRQFGGDGRTECMSPMMYGLYEQRSGVLQVTAFCTTCRDWDGDPRRGWFEPKKDHPDWETYPILKRSEPAEYPPCCVSGCPNPGNHEHHMAPRHIWGEDADNWPLISICQGHHREWHSRIREHV